MLLWLLLWLWLWLWLILWLLCLFAVDNLQHNGSDQRCRLRFRCSILTCHLPMLKML